LEKQIAELSARQKEILAARSGTFTTSVGEVPVSSVPCSGPPGSPVFCDPGGGDWFAAFSFGAWTHRKGMSQYGAKGRAEYGAGYKDILRAYYSQEVHSVDTGGTISVEGFGNLDFEGYYLLGIAEMPSSWPKEALKAQAVAARSYAYRYKQEGRAICTTEACQVFSSSKAANPPGEWRQAVEETKGEMVEGVVAYYSSTAGGYLTTMGWDTTDSQGGSGFASRAWESKAGSPWFYSSWFTESYHAASSTCGRSHPWLSSSEMADILNAWVVRRKGTDEDVKRVLPVTINSCPLSSTGGGDPYSYDELEQKAAQLGESFSSVNSVSVTYSNEGYTASVSLETDKGGVSISGAELKEAFNLRAPGFIAIRSPLFNIEKR
jgi:peptidoglycan hydrolase-like amidase